MTAALPLGTVPLEHPRRLALEPPMRARVVQLLEEGAAGIPSVGDLRGAQTVLEGGEGGVLGRVAADGVLVGRHVCGAGITRSRRPRVGGGGGHDVG